MSLLIPMSETNFSLFLQEAIAIYARENVQAGRWVEDGSVERSRIEHQNLLPKGLKTENNYIFEIVSPTGEEKVGHVWLSIENKAAFIYDIVIVEDHRKLGYASKALEAVELFVKAYDVNAISLHVFSNNTVARTLYENFGYASVSVNMTKKFEENRL